MSPDLARLRREVSRSFDLSLRALPGPMRDGVGLGYLLARASDTLADTAAVPVADRLECLDGFAAELETGDKSWRSGLAAFAGRQEHTGERELLERLDDCLRLLAELPSDQAALVREVVAIIISGQRLDLQRFGPEGGQLPDDAALEDYCHRVAGCVGVFWTRMGRLTLGSGFALVDTSRMEAWGEAFGRGLQLVNILRDVPTDLEKGRCYLPGVDAQDPASVMTGVAKWTQRAAQGLAAGRQYSSALRSWRLRTATVLPALIGEETLAKIEAADWARLQSGIKVSRAVVRSCLWQAMIFPRKDA
ncbi:MAG: squalene/phytoene synthase family protein [Akkermansiaceae bacterium]|jgi:farnesyl-diphosphate farnesyltransferase|nr:squalene/phytoene synthase family protein [Akkermansiaceae bacterium]